MLKILVTGANGQLGSEFQFLEATSQHEFTLVDINDLDITNVDAVQTYFKQHSIDLILNCAAYTAVDKAEDEPEKAYAVNHLAVENLVKICSEHDIQLIHFSTDYVFNGENHKPYVETDPVEPMGVYGKSKRAGEEAILNAPISALIIRTSWLYSVFGNNFVRTMMRLGHERSELHVIYDQVGTPTNARDLAKASFACIDKTENWQNKQQVYHYSNEGVTSWYDFALAIFDKENITCQVKPILSKDFPTKAGRPHYSVLDKHKFKTDFDPEIPNWRNALNAAEFK